MTMNMAIIWQSAVAAAEECQYLNQLQEDLKVIFLTETKCKIRFIYVGFNCKRKKGSIPKNKIDFFLWNFP